MRNIWVIMKRELYSYFLSPIAYIVLVVFLIYNGVTFYMIMEILNQPMSITGSPMSIYLGGTIFYYLVIFPICSVITMRSLASERKSGTFETLMTSPVNDVQVVLGKFLSAWLFYICLWIPTLIYPAILEAYSDPDWGPILAGYLGTALLGGTLISVGIFTSSLTKSQLVSFILSYLLISGMAFIVGLGEYIFSGTMLKEVFSYINLWSHMEDFAKGIVDTRRLIYYFSVMTLCIFGAVKTFQLKRLRS
jgi:ABC-2 type transport system permease protein